MVDRLTGGVVGEIRAGIEAWQDEDPDHTTVKLVGGGAVRAFPAGWYGEFGQLDESNMVRFVSSGVGRCDAFLNVEHNDGGLIVSYRGHVGSLKRDRSGRSGLWEGETLFRDAPSGPMADVQEMIRRDVIVLLGASRPEWVEDTLFLTAGGNYTLPAEGIPVGRVFEKEGEWDSRLLVLGDLLKEAAKWRIRTMASSRELAMGRVESDWQAVIDRARLLIAFPQIQIL